MISFRPIALADKPVFDAFFQAKRYEQSACTFTNLYMWRECYSIRWAVVEDCLCLKVTYADSTYVLPPFGPGIEQFRQALSQIEAHFAEQGLPFLIKAATPDVLEWLEAVRPGYYRFSEDRDNYDYVYNTAELIELQGRKYHIKKNHINSFKNTYSGYEYRPISAELTEECIRFAVEWCEKRGCDKDPALICERDAIIEVLRNWDYLGVTGGAILIHGRVEAFTFGEPINDNTAVIHVEKGNSDIRGIYQVINQEFCRQAWSHLQYVNREEDMGIPGIRKAKESYYPVKMIEKYDVTLMKR